MEDTLREANGSGTFFYLKNGLNPCSNGRYSLRDYRYLVIYSYPCLNPCSNGRYSLSYFILVNDELKHVLILVLMEDTLRD